LLPAHGGQCGGGGEDGTYGAVVPAADPDVAGASLSGERRDRPGDHSGEPGEYVDGQECQEHRGGGANLVAEDAAGREHPAGSSRWYRSASIGSNATYRSHLTARPSPWEGSP